ncbi:type VII secretion-associated serine protease mycosin [Streptacidiphilus sp. ASG 303]|uniref:type VII secretion-associated serine protease mycosin n=1 Tax=Streptacidiphilus sp. ASG 303 TaxID=2896847 RepID=UPI0035AFE60D
MRDTPVRRTAARTRRAAAVLCLAVLASAPAPPAAADSVRDHEWPLRALHAAEAWRTTRGAGTVVAVLDTGVDPGHPDLAGRVLPGTDTVGTGARPGDPAWARHGTAMAAVVAGRGHGPGGADGVLGIAPDARILPVRVILEDTDPALPAARRRPGNALAAGIRWAVDHGADVVNLSLGDDAETAHADPDEYAAVRYALSRGVPLVASAGNGLRSGNRSSYPAAYPGVVAVAAADAAGRPAAFSTRRWYTSVAAPGVDVVIADPDRHYYTGWGTSAAAAYVSGTLALLRSVRPDLGPAQLRAALEATADRRPPGGRSDALGAGLVDPPAALAAAARMRAEPAVPVPVPAARLRFGPVRGAGPDGGGPSPAAAPAPGSPARSGALPTDRLRVPAGLLLLLLGALLRRGRRPPALPVGASPGPPPPPSPPGPPPPPGPPGPARFRPGPPDRR